MIFLTSKVGDAVFLMLSEQDVKTMREGRTVFVDERATGGVAFKKAILSLHPTNEAAVETIRQSGHKIPGQLATHEPKDGETRCAACSGIMESWKLFEDKCIVCWATEAKRLSLSRG